MALEDYELQTELRPRFVTSRDYNLHGLACGVLGFVFGLIVGTAICTVIFVYKFSDMLR